MRLTDEEARSRLLEQLRTRAFERREVTLSSGKKSDFYIDCKQVTLDAVGDVLVGRCLFREVEQYERRTSRRIAGVGGLPLGADPIASSVAMTSALEDHPIPAFLV